ncbi:tetratricopeptide repeat protein 24 [Echinococcus multilocularis]|uniref:Tetratricopeptide repeat protein 24 n=1 Tax=Echinococcus multilocularis TaxID=6211 RepID=A0A068YEH5_ECHMU|nr:tetratricopeptide repeat protein 24 [Echinococcus multilocularis]
MAIKSVERRLSHISARSSINSANKTKELLAELCKRYATTLECLNEDTSATAVAWLKAEKAFEDCNFGRDACFSALRAVRWFMTAADLDSALSALTIALEMVKLVGKISDRGILYNELGIAFLAFELKNDSITCFRKSLKNLPEEASGARASVLQNLGSAYIAAKKLTEAIAILEQSVAAYGVMGNRAGQAQAHCNLGYAFMCMGRHKQSHWHYTLARDLAKETGWETVQTQAEAALNVLETPNFPLNIINPSPVISICPSMARLQCQVDRKIPSLSSSPSVKAKRKEKRRKRVRKGRGKQKGEQLTTILHTSDPPTKSSHSEGDIHLSTGQTSSLCKMNAIQYTIDCPSPEVIPPVGDTGISLKTPLTYLKNTASDKKLVRGVMNRKKYTRISDISSLKPPGNPNSHGDQADESLEGVMLKPVTTATLNRPRWTPFIMTSK